MNYCAIILAAGKGHRYSKSIPKQYTLFNNELIINYSIKIFSKINSIKKIILVVNKLDFSKYKKKIFKDKKVFIISGGKERKESVFLALKRIKNYTFEKVIIHDAARPFASSNLVNKIIKLSRTHDAVIPVIKPRDTIIYKNNVIDRDKLYSIQTPQSFTYKKIFNLHKNYREKKFTDESSFFYYEGLKVKKIFGEYGNIKITHEKDIFNNSSCSYGLGYDIHKLVKNRKLYLGGIRIQFPMGTAGHSDGDPVIHALIDSILGAKGLGDIGTLFPNTTKFKNKRSTYFLKKIVKLMKKRNIIINNIDINIIAEKPNLKSYKKIIAKKLAKICKIESNKVNVKGKTTDRLGNIGKSKSIACEVITSVSNN